MQKKKEIEKVFKLLDLKSKKKRQKILSKYLIQDRYDNKHVDDMIADNVTFLNKKEK